LLGKLVSIEDAETLNPYSPDLAVLLVAFGLYSEPLSSLTGKKLSSLKDILGIRAESHSVADGSKIGGTPFTEVVDWERC
jgi:hypothetical protein